MFYDNDRFPTYSHSARVPPEEVWCALRPEVTAVTEGPAPNCSNLQLLLVPREGEGTSNLE
jgi:hypothetical protein